jgi:hypothetical protein
VFVTKFSGFGVIAPEAVGTQPLINNKPMIRIVVTVKILFTGNSLPPVEIQVPGITPRALFQRPRKRRNK